MCDPYLFAIHEGEVAFMELEAIVIVEVVVSSLMHQPHLRPKDLRAKHSISPVQPHECSLADVHFYIII
jgi:hypothetical protein